MRPPVHVRLAPPCVQVSTPLQARMWATVASVQGICNQASGPASATEPDTPQRLPLQLRCVARSGWHGRRGRAPRGGRPAGAATAPWTAARRRRCARRRPQSRTSPGPPGSAPCPRPRRSAQRCRPRPPSWRARRAWAPGALQLPAVERDRRGVEPTRPVSPVPAGSRAPARAPWQASPRHADLPGCARATPRAGLGGLGSGERVRTAAGSAPPPQPTPGLLHVRWRPAAASCRSASGAGWRASRARPAPASAGPRCRPSHARAHAPGERAAPARRAYTAALSTAVCSAARLANSGLPRACVMVARLSLPRVKGSFCSLRALPSQQRRDTVSYPAKCRRAGRPAAGRASATAAWCCAATRCSSAAGLAYAAASSWYGPASAFRQRDTAVAVYLGSAGTSPGAAQRAQRRRRVRARQLRELGASTGVNERRAHGHAARLAQLQPPDPAWSAWMRALRALPAAAALWVRRPRLAL